MSTPGRPKCEFRSAQPGGCLMSPLRLAFVVAAVVPVWLAVSPPAQAQPDPIATVVGPSAGPRVDGFDVEQVAELAPGTPLNFSLYGSPGARAMLRIDGAAGALPLNEVDPGVYEGTYVVAAADRIAPASRVVAQVALAGRSTTVTLEEPLLLGASAPPARAACADCGVVETVRAVHERERPGIVGALAGSVLGALLGSQAGEGDDRAAGSILGALGGALLGREIERHNAVRIRYEVAVRGPDGVLRSRRYDAPPPLRVGDRVRLAGGAWLAEPQH